MDYALDIRGLTKAYATPTGRREALSGVDLAIKPGTVLGLLGPNGAGKSTLINILAGLVTKTSGKVTIWGFDQDINPRQSRAAIGVMPQELNMDPFFTPRQSLEVQAGLYGVPKSERRTDEILEFIGLADKANAYARALSGGMRRRLLLGKALVHNPRVLILDEPTAGVDIELRQMLWENVRRLNREGVTIILTTHYLEEAQDICDEIAIIDKGKLRLRETTERLLARMDAKSLLVKLASEHDLASLPMPEGVQVSRDEQGWVSFTYPRSKLHAGQILAVLSGAGVEISDLRTSEPDLEDAFLALTRDAGSDLEPHTAPMGA